MPLSFIARQPSAVAEPDKSPYGRRDADELSAEPKRRRSQTSRSTSEREIEAAQSHRERITVNGFEQFFGVADVDTTSQRPSDHQVVAGPANRFLRSE